MITVIASSPSIQGEQYGPTVSDPPIALERRSRVRYRLALSVRFRALSSRSPFSGVGRTMDLSSAGVCVVPQDSKHQIRVGAEVEMKIEWPSRLDGRIPLQLLAVGRVVRHGASGFAATLDRHEFRTVRISSEPTAHMAREARSAGL